MIRIRSPDRRSTVSARIGFVGAGNLASSLIGGLLAAGWSADSILAADPDADTRAAIDERFGIITAADNADVVAHADVVVLCVKPQVMQAVARDLAQHLRPEQTAISVAAGIPAGALRTWLGGEQAPGIIRAMPNTPALLGEGATGLYAHGAVSDAGRTAATDLFDAVGVTLWVEKEVALDWVIAVAGSAPAYFFAFMEAISAAGAKLGLPAEAAQQLTIATALGAARMAAEAGEAPDELRRRVTSPGGTTAEAIKHFEQHGLDKLVAGAMDAAVARAAEMAKEFGENA